MHPEFYGVLAQQFIKGNRVTVINESEYKIFLLILSASPGFDLKMKERNEREK